VALTKEQQSEAAARILAKEPMTEQELRRQKFLEMKPEDYPTNRICPDCSAMFPREQIEEHAAHMATHAPTAGQWVEAHQKIVQGKDSAKAAEKATLSA
jgi:hypothetical protein